MKTFAALLLLIYLLAPVPSRADEFLGVPLVDGGRVTTKTDRRLEMISPLSHDAAVSYYRSVLKETPDIKFREWGNATYIEDDGKLPWHSITVSRGDDRAGSTISIVRDSWTWILGTLALRYVGVFTVLVILFIGMAAAGGIISRSVGKLEARKAG